MTAPAQGSAGDVPRLPSRIPVLVRLAARNVVRETRRSLLTSAAMVLGLALLILSRSLADGAHEDWIDSGVRLSSGHVSVQAPDFQETGSFRHRMEPSTVQRVTDALASLPAPVEMVQVAPRLSVQGLGSSATSALPLLIEGVDPAAEARFSLLAEQVAEGRYLEPGDGARAYVGVGFARRLGLRLGSRFVVTAQTASGDIEGLLLRVVGMFEFGIQEMDEGVIHIPRTTAADWLGAEGEATTIAVLLGSSLQVPAAIASLEGSLADQPVRVLSWREASPELDSAVRMDDYGDYFFHILLFAIVALAILNSVLMAVLNRKREFGLLRALGLSSAETGGLVMLEGVLVTAFSGVVGMALGVAIVWFFFRDGLDVSGLMDSDFTFSGIVMDPVMVPRLRLAHLLQGASAILVIGVLSSIYPALHAARLDVAESVKFEN